MRKIDLVSGFVGSNSGLLLLDIISFADQKTAVSHGFFFTQTGKLIWMAFSSLMRWLF